MFPLVWSAIAARRASSLVILVLAALTTFGLSIAPGYAAQSTDRATTARIAATPDTQRTVSANTPVSLEQDPAGALRTFGDSARSALALPVDRELVGAEVSDNLRAGDRLLAVDLRYRDNVCAELIIAGNCPHATGDVVLSGQTASRLGVGVGDTLTYTQVPLRLVGTYRPRDPLAWPWSAGGDAAWTTLDTVAQAHSTVQATYDAVLGNTVFSQPEAYVAALARLNRVPLQVTTTGGALAARITADRQAVRRGALIAALQLFVIGWVALAVAAGYAAQERRLDVGQLLLRGARRWRVLAAASGQSAAPLLLGVVLGFLGAYAVTGRPEWRIAGAVAVAGLIAAVLADWRATRAPVEQLLRAVPPRPPKLSVAVVEASVLALTAASVYQSLSSPDPIGLQLLTPAFLAASVAILLGRLVAPAAAASAGPPSWPDGSPRAWPLSFWPGGFPRTGCCRSSPPVGACSRSPPRTGPTPPTPGTPARRSRSAASGCSPSPRSPGPGWSVPCTGPTPAGTTRWPPWSAPRRTGYRSSPSTRPACRRWSPGRYRSTRRSCVRPHRRRSRFRRRR